MFHVNILMNIFHYFYKHERLKFNLFRDRINLMEKEHFVALYSILYCAPLGEFDMNIKKLRALIHRIILEI